MPDIATPRYARALVAIKTADRCIEEVWVELGTIHMSSERQLDAIENIIRDYREKKEAK